VSDMLGQTDGRRQSTGGPAGSARMPPRGASTTGGRPRACGDRVVWPGEGGGSVCPWRLAGAGWSSPPPEHIELLG